MDTVIFQGVDQYMAEKDSRTKLAGYGGNISGEIVQAVNPQQAGQDNALL